ncbi:MAG: galactokinase family protein [Varibaculum sp.]|nr:galactokinase family protein [Varibaculum sp.]
MIDILQPWSDYYGYSGASRLFEQRYGEKVNHVHSAPACVNLLGDHTDYNGGLALPISLSYRTFVAAHARRDRKIRLMSATDPEVDTGVIHEFSLDEVGPRGSAGEVQGWEAYVVGVAWAMERNGWELPGFDMAIDSCVPYRSGLSASAALQCAAAVAIDHLSTGRQHHSLGGEGEYAVRRLLAKSCIQAENEVAGVASTGLDQFAALFGEPGVALSLDFSTDSFAPLSFDLSVTGLALLVVNTRVYEDKYIGQGRAERVSECAEAARILGVDSLSAVGSDSELRAGALPPRLLRRARHVVSENARVRQAIDLLNTGQLVGERVEAFGELLTESHESLRFNYEVSTPQLDCVVYSALDFGALGARMTGTGFGGSAIVLTRESALDELVLVISDAFRLKGFPQPQFLSGVPGVGAR